ncbi:MAG: hypothetical protein ACE5GM_04565 [bacterium]
MIIIATFSMQCITGMPLKFAGAAWTFPVARFWGGAFMMGRMHRISGLTMIAFVVYHLLYVIVVTVVKARKMYRKYPSESFGDGALKLLKMIYNLPFIPRGIDGRNIADFVKYSLFLSNKGPQYPKWIWKEKFEYIAFLAGGVIIMSTGLMLFFPTVTATILPSRSLNIAWIIHTNEAMLAMAVIFIWHFYHAIFAPEKFPADGTVIDGVISEHHMIDEHVLEYKRIILEGPDHVGLVKTRPGHGSHH